MALKLKKRKETAELVKEAEDNAGESLIDDISYKPFEGNMELVVSTGSTLLDLEISGNRIRGGGIPGGILVEVFGPSGSGKCITGDTLIYANNKLSCISDFSKGENNEGYTQQEVYLSSKEGISKSTHYFEQKINHTIKIKNSLGLELEGTTKHPILCLNKDASVSFKKLQDVRIGDYVCIARGMGSFPKKQWKIPKFNQLKRKNTKTIKLPKVVNNSIARLLGYMIGNGSGKGKGGFGFSSANKKLQEDMSAVLKEINSSLSTSCNNKDFALLGGANVKRLLSSLLEKASTARYKQVPKCILESPKEQQLSFLQGLFDCDSYVCEDKGTLEYSTASEVLARQVQMMLLNLGIISSRKSKYLKEYNRTYWSLFICGKDTNTLLTSINSIKYKNCVQKEHKDVRDRIPFLKEYLCTKLENIKQKYSWSSNGLIHYQKKAIRFSIGHLLHSHNNKLLTYDYLKHFIIKLQKLLYIPEVKELFDVCMWFQNNHFFFSSIVSVKRKNENVKVYDFTIPKTHNFVSNGYISHNTAIIAEVCGSAQKRGGEVNFTDPEARLDQEYTQIYGVTIEKDFFNYSRPDTVTELISSMQSWKPANNDVINVFAGDSVAALSTNMEMEDEDKRGQRRAKEFSEGLRKVCRLIRKNNWIVIFSNQVRQGEGHSYVTPGGMAVPFYASLRIQLGPDPSGGKIKKKVKLRSGKEVTSVVGINSICTIVKSSVDIPFKTAPISIVFNYGIDDVRQNLQYCKDMLNETKYDAVSKQFVSLEAAINHIEDNNLEEELREKTIDLWEDIQKQIKIQRKVKGRR